jgi:hypothetical protein
LNIFHIEKREKWIYDISNSNISKMKNKVANSVVDVKSTLSAYKSNILFKGKSSIFSDKANT